MRVVVCPDKFRGSLSANQAVAAIIDGLVDAGVTDVVRAPMADGGEGTLDALVAVLGGDTFVVDTVDALGRPTRAPWALLPDGTAVVEAATCIGLAMLGDVRDPLGASSAGLGRVIDAALRARPERLLVAVGGVASTDGGLGCLDVLGWDLRGVDTTVATDVSTVFVDSAATFAPQKGADPAQVAVLTERLRHLAERFAAQHRDVASLPGSGAAGGIAGGLAAVGARLRSGSTLVAELIGLPAMIASADVVVTGEGRLDRTSLDGKVVGAVLGLAAHHRRVVLAGQADEPTVQQLRADGTVVRTLRELADSDAQSMAEAELLLRRVAADVARHLLREA